MTSDAAPPTRLGVVIVSYRASRRAADLALVVAPAAHDVVIVSNGPDGEQAASERRWDRWVHLDNPGYGAAANAGERALADDVDLVVVLTDDVTLDPGVLEDLAADLVARPDVGLIGPELIDARDGSVWSHGGTILGRGRNPHHLRPGRDLAGPPQWLDCAVLMMRRDDYRRIGGFDESFFLYYEDVDLGRRVTADLERQIVCRTDLRATQVPGDHLTPYLDTRNRLRLQRKHGERVALALMVGETLARLTLGTVVSPKGAADRLRERGRGLLHGLKRA